MRLYTGRAARYPSVEEAERYPCSAHELAIVRHARRRTITGAAEQVRESLLALTRDYAADELVVVTITHSPEARAPRMSFWRTHSGSSAESRMAH